MKTQTIARHGVKLSIPIGCKIIERDYMHGMPLSCVLIYHYPERKKVIITYECRGAYSGYDVKRFGKDGYIYFVIFINN